MGGVWETLRGGCTSAPNFLIPSCKRCVPFSLGIKETVTPQGSSRVILFCALLCQLKGTQGENGGNCSARWATRHLLSLPGFTMLEFKSWGSCGERPGCLNWGLRRRDSETFVPRSTLLLRYSPRMRLHNQLQRYKGCGSSRNIKPGSNLGPICKLIYVFF